ncbi:hypothetical protein DSM106972_019420 [Dulcicalothrix desertica PCC 7102]|uniref:SLH domain-containing protein n=1 Tax=Dulcicalothrix desertica PCC 7102 TaxID=232991 RepID=A0A433VNS7_9CYAN|nr:hypothetical protein [Dulcicalothrix desertica]RUT07682.1 hypothetical protein DSM106972_019420 [Dulcicalothrix desertica PCC 7102]TWH39853.1 hypothetical protein CAL7102_09116 [Dulcicalothrix desertica PCC 7102]
MLKKLLILVSLTSPLWVITASTAQTQPTEAEIREACTTGQVNKLPSPYTDVSKNHWAYTAVASLYYCKSRGIFGTAPTSQLQTEQKFGEPNPATPYKAPTNPNN